MVPSRPAITTTSYPRCTWCDSPLEKGVCLYCEATEAKSSPIGTALAGIYDLIRMYHQLSNVERVITIPEFDSSLRAILEALVEDVESNASLTRSVRP